MGIAVVSGRGVTDVVAIVDGCCLWLSQGLFNNVSFSSCVCLSQNGLLIVCDCSWWVHFSTCVVCYVKSCCKDGNHGSTFDWWSFMCGFIRCVCELLYQFVAMSINLSKVCFSVTSISLPSHLQTPFWYEYCDGTGRLWGICDEVVSGSSADWRCWFVAAILHMVLKD